MFSSTPARPESLSFQVLFAVAGRAALDCDSSGLVSFAKLNQLADTVYQILWDGRNLYWDIDRIQQGLSSLSAFYTGIDLASKPSIVVEPKARYSSSDARGIAIEFK